MENNVVKSQTVNSINELRKNYSPPRQPVYKPIQLSQPRNVSPRKAHDVDKLLMRSPSEKKIRNESPRLISDGGRRSNTNSITSSESGSVKSSNSKVSELSEQKNPLEFLSHLSGTSISLIATVFVIAVMAYRITFNAAFFGSLSVTGDVSFGSDTFFIDSASGNVGIRTQTPEKSFVVNGESLFKGDLTIGTTRFVATPATLSPNGDGKSNTMRPDADVQGSLNVMGDMNIIGDLSARRTIFQEIDTSRQYTIGGEVVLTATSLGDGVVNSKLQNVGVLDHLDVANNFTVGTADFVVNTDSGKVGINTDDPEETLDVRGTAVITERLFVPSIEASETSLNLGCGSQTHVINIGVSETNPKIINIGSTNGFVNIHGSVFSSQATNLEVTDKIITLNRSGLPGSSAGSGFEVEEGLTRPAYLKINAERDSWLVKAPESQEGKLVTTIGPQFVSSGSDLYYTSGNVGIGTTMASGAKLHVGNGNIKVDNDYGYTVGSSTVINKTSLGDTVVNSQLKTVGELTNLTVDGSVLMKSAFSAPNLSLGNGIPLAIDANGQIVKVASSKRYKTNIRDLSNVVDSERTISRLQPKTYEYKSLPGKTMYGMIAEEVEEVNPNFVSYTPEGEIEGIQYFQMIPFLVEEVKKIPELRREIESLKNLVSVLSLKTEN